MFASRESLISDETSQDTRMSFSSNSTAIGEESREESYEIPNESGINNMKKVQEEALSGNIAIWYNNISMLKKILILK